jgi:hypothetical protein
MAGERLAVLQSGDKSPHAKTDVRVVPTEAGVASRNDLPAKKTGKPAITIDSQRSRDAARKRHVLPGELHLD